MTKFRKHYPDQDPPKAHPQRCITVFPDHWAGERIAVLIAHNKRDQTLRAVSLSLDDAEEMARLILQLVADARPTEDGEG